MPEDSDLLTAEEAGVIIGVTGETVRRWSASRLITYIELPSGQRRYRRSDIEAILVPVEPTEASA